MFQFISCTMGICKGSSDILQESIQERISQMHSKGQDQQNTFAKDYLQRHRSEDKKIFSFRLNGFRQYEESDKKKDLNYRGLTEERDTIIRLHHYKSSEKTRNSICQYEPSYLQANRLLYNSSPLRPQSRLQVCSNDEINNSCVPLSTQSHGQKQHRVIIPATIPPRKDIERFHKQSSQTQHSSKKSQNPSLCPKIKIAAQSFVYTFQQAFPAPNKADGKCEPQNLYASFMSKNSNNEQKINAQFPTFVHLESTEAPRFFEDMKTIKTIVSKQSHNQDSMRTSIKDFNEKHEDSPRTMQMTRTQKNCMRKEKKKTAFFNVAEQQNETQKTLIDRLREDEIRQENMEQQSDYLHSSQRGNYRTVKFCLSHSNNPSIAQNYKFTKQNRPKSKCANKKIVPSLHNLVQSSKKQQIGIGNSMQQLNQPEESAFKYKYANTIKSIGGQSILSQNSYIDIKYMQSINSKRAIHRLI